MNSSSHGLTTVLKLSYARNVTGDCSSRFEMKNSKVLILFCRYFTPQIVSSSPSTVRRRADFQQLSLDARHSEQVLKHCTAVEAVRLH